MSSDTVGAFGGGGFLFTKNKDHFPLRIAHSFEKLSPRSTFKLVENNEPPPTAHPQTDDFTAKHHPLQLVSPSR